jgi:hypothetical protein
MSFSNGLCNKGRDVVIELDARRLIFIDHVAAFGDQSGPERIHAQQSRGHGRASRFPAMAGYADTTGATGELIYHR